MQLQASDSTFERVFLCPRCSKMFQDVPRCSKFIVFINLCRRPWRTGPQYLAFLRKFAASPAVVVLCGMAAGAGFGSLENVQYVAKVGRLLKIMKIWRSRFLLVKSPENDKDGYALDDSLLKTS